MRIKGLAFLPLLLAASLAACSGEPQPESPPPPPVTVATPLQQEVRDWDDYVGRFEAIQDVNVTPRASGYLQVVHFRDGDFVREGQLLFTIDPRPAQAQLDQARAQLARAEATLVNARTELARSRTLAQSQAASTEEVEQRQAALRAAEADVNAGRANVRAQSLNLGFTRVVAPISGRISQRRVDPGNPVIADQTVLTTIVSTDPLHFAFDGSEALLLRYQRQNAGRQAGSEVRIRLQDEATYAHSGRLDFLDNAINPGSGTIAARAIVPNPDGFLKPGMVGQLRLAGTPGYRALLVPDTAIATDGIRRLVYVVDREGNATGKPVQLGPLVGNLRVIRGGIAPQERVVIDGLQRIMPGQKVTPRMGRIQPPSNEQAPAEPVQSAPASVATPVAAGGR
ncbi:efflux RND transporter periplasmic adaptor subunit [Sphingosinicella sp. LHD-64]|uniref:efflux RND transporter periplasmic adaptor subunit n=1 Tax=Sphingosinicella sp. LHD-64 TaxID=3072139 RepID=UPI00280DD9BE|nr:efflux RND transporter periplasmic adaptor subunit [Sphingosinicella sp. LHD-64]MDQ8755427.1 efflux RND transporter periplasmic adaptor subunit [Sphingosinicella sp. LHD-64]